MSDTYSGTADGTANHRVDVADLVRTAAQDAFDGEDDSGISGPYRVSVEVEAVPTDRRPDGGSE